MILDHLSITHFTSKMTMNHFLNKVQDEMIRFVYCGVQKTSKVSIAILKLYPQIKENEDLEFSLGILVRSVLMDMILAMGVKKIYLKYNGGNYELIKDEIKSYCFKVINDGTKHFLDEIDSSQKLSEKEKKEHFEKFTASFSNAFDFSSPKPKLKKEYNLRLAEIYYESKDSSFVTGEAIYNLYSYYSKYDHLSHWTSLSQKIPFEQRKGKLDLAVILIVMHLRDILSIAYDFDENYKVLLPYITDLNEHLKKNYSE